MSLSHWNPELKSLHTQRRGLMDRWRRRGSEGRTVTATSLFKKEKSPIQKEPTHSKLPKTISHFPQIRLQFSFPPQIPNYNFQFSPHLLLQKFSEAFLEYSNSSYAYEPWILGA